MSWRARSRQRRESSDQGLGALTRPRSPRPGVPQAGRMARQATPPHVRLNGMKLKRQPDDFQVEEIPLVQPGERGRYIFYRLSKSGLGTLEALEAIRRRWNLPER